MRVSSVPAVPGRRTPPFPAFGALLGPGQGVVVLDASAGAARSGPPGRSRAHGVTPRGSTSVTTRASPVTSQGPEAPGRKMGMAMVTRA